jgi:hypothetical protein
VRAHPQHIGNQNVYKCIGIVELFLFESANVHSDSFLLVKNNLKVEQVGLTKGDTHLQQIATQNVYESVGIVELFVFGVMNVHSDSFLFAKNDFKVEQVGPNKGSAHICNKLKLKTFTSALASSNCSCLEL